MDSYAYIPFIPVCIILADIFVENVMKHKPITKLRRFAADDIVINVKESEPECLNTEE
jgi:hypothetical protein